MAERLVASQKKKKVETTRSPIIRSRIDHLVRVTPELVVRKRARTVESEEEEESEDPGAGRRLAKQQKMDSLQQQMAKMLEGMEDLKKNVATKDDIRGVNSRLRTIESEHKNLDSRLTRLERDKANAGRPMAGQRPRPIQSDRSDLLSAEYRKARRSIMISPVTGGEDGIKHFLINNLKIPEEVVKDLQMENIRPIHPKKLPAHRKETTEAKKLHLSLRDSYERDLVVSYTVNLEFPARLDIVIPEHLQSQKAKLEGLAYKIRKHAKDTADKKIMTSLRLEDKTEGLVMAVREDRDEPWLHYTFQELKQLESKLGRTGVDVDDGEEGDEFV